jgi:enamine deaminase RidA (YjgF/YER057c/UK114 family)
VVAGKRGSATDSTAAFVVLLPNTSDPFACSEISGSRSIKLVSEHTFPNTGEVLYINPDTLLQNRAFTNVVVVRGGARTVYVGAQYAIDVVGNVVGKGDLQAQVAQVLRNLKAALVAAGAQPHHVVKWTMYVVQGQEMRSAFGVFPQEWGHGDKPPAITMFYVAGLLNPEFLVAMDAVAVVPE